MSDLTPRCADTTLWTPRCDTTLDITLVDSRLTDIKLTQKLAAPAPPAATMQAKTIACRHTLYMHPPSS